MRLDNAFNEDINAGAEFSHPAPAVFITWRFGFA
jgi:hypothetical protein